MRIDVEIAHISDQSGEHVLKEQEIIKLNFICNLI